MERSGDPGRRSNRQGSLPPRESARPTPALRALVEDSDEGMILADGAGTVLYANPASERLLGRPPADLLGTSGFDMCRAEHLSLARDAFARSLAQPGRAVSLQVDINHAAGGTRTLAVRLINRLPEPGVSAVVVHFREFTDRSLDELEEEHYRAVFEAAPIGLGVADLGGQLLVFNNAMMQPGGYTPDDILAIGNVANLYCRPADRERVLAIAQKQGFLWRHEVQFRAKSGSCYDTLLSLAPVQFGGRRCWLAAVEDITERKQAEEQQRQLEVQLRQAQKMEAVGQMTAGIAHDFNNVLSVIIGSADLIAGALGKDARLEDLAELRSAAERGAAMVQKLLGYSRQAALKVEPTDLAGLMEGLRGMLRHLVPEPITIDMHCVPQSVAVVDPSAVEQIVLNLATNARDAMAGRGALRIDVRPTVVGEGEVTAPWMSAGAYVQVSVTDTGIGMDEATRARVFEPFFTTKPAGVGTGLGLSMVYGLVKQQGGYVDVQSAPGKGTTVSLYFPEVKVVSAGR